jgi:O-antigen ligase
LYRIVLVAVCGLVLLSNLALGRVAFSTSLRTGLIGSFSLYLGLCFVSCVWSVHPAWTAYKSVELLVTLGILAVVVSRVDSFEHFKTLFDWTWILLGLMVITVWAGVFIWPEAVRMKVGLMGFQISGVYPAVAANGVGDLGALLGLVAFSRILTSRKNRHFYIAILILALATLIVSYSRTPLCGFAAAAALVLYLVKRRYLPVLLLGLANLIPIILGTPLKEVFWLFITRGQTPETILSLSGRIAVWTPTIELVRENLLGFGAYAGTRVYLPKHTDLIVTSSVDNEWLEILAGTGILGLLLFAVVFVRLWKCLFRQLRDFDNNEPELNLIIESIGLLTFMTVRSFFVTKFFIWHAPLVFLAVLGYAEMLRRSKPKKDAPDLPMAV